MARIFVLNRSAIDFKFRPRIVWKNRGRHDIQPNDTEHNDTQRKGRFVTQSINDTQYNNTVCSGECRYTACRILFIAMLSIVMLSVIMLNVVVPKLGLI
jgi:hypothetical protein